jgi:hypothetical protein
VAISTARLPKKIGRALVRHASCKVAADAAISEVRAKELEREAEKSWNDVARVVTELVKTLQDEAALLERWAAESRNGGWSTHQVDAQLRRAADLRAQLARLEEP